MSEDQSSVGEFSGKRALVTGAGKGIGREIAIRLHASGADVIGVSRTARDLDELAGEIGCETIVADLASEDGLDAVRRGASDVDLLVNNAGTSIPEAVVDVTLKAFDATIAVNVRAALLLTRHVARNLIQRQAPGAIVNISSMVSTAALPDHVTYGASKAALDQITRIAALELGPHGIRVNAVNPTVTLTPLGKKVWSDRAKKDSMVAKIPLGRFAEPSEITDAVTFLLSERAAMITGETLSVDGGYLVA